MTLSIVEAEVLHETPAGGIGTIVVRVSSLRISEELLPLRVARELVRVVEGVAAFMPEDLQQFLARPSLDLEHLLSLQFHQAGVGQVERNGDSGNAVGDEPF